jgi:predicted esterase YcpF (UPF0227 family)
MKCALFRLFLVVVLFCDSASLSQEHSSQDQSARDLVREVVSNELNAQQRDHTHWMYRLETEKAGTREVMAVIETIAGDLTRLLSRNDQLLTDQQRIEEDQRTEKFINNPEEQRKRQHDQNEDVHKAEQLLAVLPDALNFSYAERDGDTITLNFQPNPEFHPTSREAHAFREMEGQLIVDEGEKRVREIRGHLRNTVHFGLLGHLDPGGTFDVRQEEVGQKHWEITLLKVNMRGKALVFKTINVQQDETRSHFQQVPDTLTLPQARDLLQKRVSTD